jgi:hypothetical protein
MKINVTQEHIDNGRRNCADACPIALAVKDAEADAAYISVSRDSIFIDKENQSHGILMGLPWSARRFVDNFDHEGCVQPFSFEAYVKYP